MKIQRNNCYVLSDFPKEIQELIQAFPTQGPADIHAEELSKVLTVNSEHLRLWLKDFGAWDTEELENDEDNLQRLAWILALDIKENDEFFF